MIVSEQAHAIATHKIQADQAAKLATQQQNDTQTLHLQSHRLRALPVGDA